MPEVLRLISFVPVSYFVGGLLMSVRPVVVAVVCFGVVYSKKKVRRISQH